MKTVMLEGNIFDKLSEDAGARDLIHRLRNERRMMLIVPQIVHQELAGSPHLHLVESLHIEVVGNATPVAGVMRAGDYLGDAEHYFKHKGDSNKANDAMVAAAAQFHADWLVTEDRRLTRRQQRLSKEVKVFGFKEFVEAAHGLWSDG